MADYGTLPISPKYTYNRSPSSSFFNPPKKFTTFSSKGSESLISPTSILDSKSSSTFSYPFCSDVSTPKDSKVQWEKLDSKGVGLGILDALAKGNSDSKMSKPEKSPTVLFCSKLKIEIPSIVPFINEDSPKSPGDFGIKTRNSLVCPSSPGLSPSSVKKSVNSGLEKSNSTRVLSGLSITEMELSEEYTCVMSHGPNPKTTHIFDDCVIDSCYADLGGGVFSSVNEKECFINPSITYPSESFLSFCHNCKKNLHQGNDIYIYRGEEAFCSSDCRYKEMNKANLSLH